MFHGIDVLGAIKALTSPFDNLPLHLFKAINVLIHCWQYIMVQVKSCPYKISPAAEEANHCVWGTVCWGRRNHWQYITHNT